MDYIFVYIKCLGALLRVYITSGTEHGGCFRFNRIGSSTCADYIKSRKRQLYAYAYGRNYIHSCQLSAEILHSLVILKDLYSISVCALTTDNIILEITAGASYFNKSFYRSHTSIRAVI